MTTAITRVTRAFPRHRARRAVPRWFALAALLALVAAPVLTPAVGAAATGQGVGVSAAYNSGQRIGVPAYFTPTSKDDFSPYDKKWDRLIGPRSARPVTAINPQTLGMVVINPQDKDALTPAQAKAERLAYIGLIARAQYEGITVLAYVHTQQGTRPWDDYKDQDTGLLKQGVHSDLDDYLTPNADPTLTYNVNGIFLDQASDETADLEYYRTIYSYIKAKGAAKKVVLNPGNYPEDQGYMAISDVIVACENTYAGYVATCTPPAWAYSYPANRFWHLVHTTASLTEMRKAVTLSKQRNAGWVYVTPDIELTSNLECTKKGCTWVEAHVNPWDTLPAPTYWSAEREAVGGIVQGPACIPGWGC